MFANQTSIPFQCGDNLYKSLFLLSKDTAGEKDKAYFVFMSKLRTSIYFTLCSRNLCPASILNSFQTQTMDQGWARSPLAMCTQTVRAARNCEPTTNNIQHLNYKWMLNSGRVLGDRTFQTHNSIFSRATQHNYDATFNKYQDC